MPVGQIPDELKKLIPDLGGSSLPEGTFSGLGALFKEMFGEIVNGIKKSFKFMGKNRE